MSVEQDSVVVPDGTDLLLPALTVAIGELKNPPETGHVKAGAASWKFAPLPVVLDLIRKIFAQHGLALMQPLEVDLAGMHVYVQTWVLHTSGQIFRLPAMTMPFAKPTPHEIGAAATYGKRIALQAAFGVAGDGDDDAVELQRSATPPAPTNKVRGRAVSAAQLKKLGAAFDAVEIGRDDRHDVARDLIGRPIKSASELTVGEASKLLDALTAVASGSAILEFGSDGVFRVVGTDPDVDS